MKKFAKICVILPLFALLFIALVGAIKPEWKLVSRVAGVVESQRSNETQWLKIYAQKSLRDGDKARTLEDSRATILLADQSVVTVGENTTVEIARFQLKEDARIVELKMGIGRIKAKVAKFIKGESRFQVETEKAVLAAKGTEFYVDVQKAAAGEQSKSGLMAWNGQGPVADAGNVFFAQASDEMVYLQVLSGEVLATSSKGTHMFYSGDKGYIDGQGAIFVNPSVIPEIFTDKPGWTQDSDMRQDQVRKYVTGPPPTSPELKPYEQQAGIIPPQPPVLQPSYENTGTIHISIRSRIQSFLKSGSFVQPAPAVLQNVVPSPGGGSDYIDNSGGGGSLTKPINR